MHYLPKNKSSEIPWRIHNHCKFLIYLYTGWPEITAPIQKFIFSLTTINMFIKLVTFTSDGFYISYSVNVNIVQFPWIDGALLYPTRIMCRQIWDFKFY